MARYRDPHLPLSSLRLLVPPLRLMSACMWQVALERNVHQYDKPAEFIALVTEIVPELLIYKQRTQLILGLRARSILEFVKQEDPDCKTIKEHLDIFQKSAATFEDEKDQDDGEVEISKTAFVELVQTLLDDKYEKDKFLKILSWEFLYRLEEFLPVPSFPKVSSLFDLSPSDFQFDEFVSDLSDLRKILQDQKQRKKLIQSEFSFMSDTILSTLASKQTLVASEGHVESVKDEKGGDSSDEEADDCSAEPNQESAPSSHTSSLCTEEAAAEDHARSLVPQSACTQVILLGQISEQPDVDGVQESCSEGEMELNLPSAVDATEKYAYPVCHKNFWKPVMLSRHLRTKHPTFKQLYRCDRCEKTFRTKRRLEQHFQAHTEVKPYVCSFCGKGLLCPKVLKTHLRLHTGERPYACKFCDKKFDQPYLLTQHIRVHNGEKPYLCSECGKTFSNSSAFLVHTRLHTGERPYHCKDCGAKYITLQRLQVHQRIHTDERPFVCPHCGKHLRIQSALITHNRIHTEERPYKCVVCEIGFYCSHNL